MTLHIHALRRVAADILDLIGTGFHWLAEFAEVEHETTRRVVAEQGGE